MRDASSLRVEDLFAGYEPGAPIVRGASLAVASGEIVAVLGPNGAGKSTLVKAIAGLVPVERGRVLLDGRDATAVPAHERVRHGLAFVPQTENVFTLMSVSDNLRLAGDILPRREAAARTEEICAFFPDLGRAWHLAAGRLSGGQRQMLAVARALMTSPKVVMLDEPSAGLSPKLVATVFARIAELRRTGVALILVEQNTRAALAIADRALVLVEGRNAHEGPAAELAADPDLGALYLGARRSVPLPA
ncbi:MAG TPA: ABC transporter ATP-binding protein [Lichenihabitans sp.]|nr:ABC transporter ATP-binding protein [Lichenihabitans sp.]